MQPPASHAQSARACGLRSVFSRHMSSKKRIWTFFRRLRTAELCEALRTKRRNAHYPQINLPCPIGRGGLRSVAGTCASFKSLCTQLQLLDLEGALPAFPGLEGLQDRLSDTQKDIVPNL